MKPHIVCYCFRCIALDLVPYWFRTKWPLKRFYWQQEEIDEAIETANRVKFLMEYRGKHVQ